MFNFPQTPNSPVRLGLRSMPSSFGLQSSSKFSYFAQKRDSGLGEDGLISQIKFHYISGETYSLSNRELKLRNQSKNFFLKFTIQCNNPLHYKVFPPTGDIPPGKAIQISIQIVGVQEINQLKRNFFAKFASDRFKITWYSYKESDRQYDQNISKIKKPTNVKILTVSVDYDEEPVLERQIRKNPLEVEKKVEQSLDIHKSELKRLEDMIGQKESKRVDQIWFYPRFLGFVCLAAFAIGFLLPI